MQPTCQWVCLAPSPNIFSSYYQHSNWFFTATKSKYLFRIIGTKFLSWYPGPKPKCFCLELATCLAPSANILWNDFVHRNSFFWPKVQTLLHDYWSKISKISLASSPNACLELLQPVWPHVQIFFEMIWSIQIVQIHRLYFFEKNRQLCLFGL